MKGLLVRLAGAIAGAGLTFCVGFVGGLAAIGNRRLLTACDAIMLLLPPVVFLAIWRPWRSDDDGAV